MTILLNLVQCWILVKCEPVCIVKNAAETVENISLTSYSWACCSDLQRYTISQKLWSSDSHTPKRNAHPESLMSPDAYEHEQITITALPSQFKAQNHSSHHLITNPHSAKAGRGSYKLVSSAYKQPHTSPESFSQYITVTHTAALHITLHTYQ